MTSKIPVPSALWPSLSPAVALGGTSWAASAKSSAFQQFAAVRVSVCPQKPGGSRGIAPSCLHCKTRSCHSRSCRRDRGPCRHSHTRSLVWDDRSHEAVPARAPARDRQHQWHSCSTKMPSQSPCHRTGMSQPSPRDRDILVQAGTTPTCCTPQPETWKPARASQWFRTSPAPGRQLPAS